jgi:spermidine/putrescine transport system permease protein
MNSTLDHSVDDVITEDFPNPKKKFFDLELTVLIGPLASLVLIFTFLPLVITLFFSFMKLGEDGLMTSGFSIQNYINAFSGTYGEIFLRSFYYAVQTNIICIIIAFPVAYYITQYGGRWKAFLILMLVIPETTAVIIRIYAVKTMLGNTGVINSVLMTIGMIDSPIRMLYSPFAVMFGLVYYSLPYMILPIYASLDGLNPSLLEAATDMGATPVRRFFRVILPLTKGGVFAGTILVFIPALGDYLVPTFLGGSKVMMVGNLVTHKYMSAGDIPGGSAFGVVLTAMLIVVLFIVIKKGGEDALEKAL